MAATFQRCRPCDGSGRDLEDGTICGVCRNGGAECPACEGTGKIDTDDCGLCAGRGGCGEIEAERYLAFMAKVDEDAAANASEYATLVEQAGA